VWHLGRDLARRNLPRRNVPRRASSVETLAGTKMAFVPGDVLLSPGGSWEDPSYLDVVGAWRRQVGLRLVPLVYDLIPHRCPQFFPPRVPPVFSDWLKRVLGLADRIVTISENSRRDLLAFAAAAGTALPVDRVRLGDRLPVRGPGQCPEGRLPEGQPYVLTVGTVEIRKNHVLLYRVWRRLLEEHGCVVPPLVIAGQRGWLCDDLQYEVRNDPLVKDRILLIEGLHDGELDWLYRHCLFTLFPSHCEGWGLPVCESLAHGKYCIASNRSSLPEIAGPLIDYHDPYDFAACKALVEKALFDEPYRRRREDDIQRNYRKTSWADCASELWSIVLAESARAGPVRRCA
jgi:glycosyltransferase involved in cell wall biosynthesis